MNALSLLHVFVVRVLILHGHDDIRDDDEWATKDDADISPFQYPWKEYFIVDDNPDDDWNLDN